MSNLLTNHAWPYPTLSKFHEPGEEPNQQLLDITIQEVRANATSIETRIGAGEYAFLGIVTEDAEYQLLTGAANPWAPPVQPDQHPNIPPRASHAEAARRTREHATSWEQYNLYLAAHNTLKTQLLQAADGIYWEALKVPGVGYRPNLTAREIIQHIRDKYGEADEIQRENIRKRMNQPWNGNHILTVISQINTGATQLTTCRGACNPTEKMDLLYKLVNESGLLPEACKKWHMKRTADKTWTNAVTHFKEEAKYRKYKATTGNQGMANRATQVEQEQEQQRAHEANLVNENNNYKQENQRLTTELSSLQAQLEIYKAMLGQITLTDSTNKRGTWRERKLQEWKNKKHYCWTHGYQDDHSSKDCTAKETGHKDNATKTNPQGGRGHKKANR